MRTGIVNLAHNRYSYSDSRQTVNIPANATSATLSFWIYASSGEVASLPLPEIPSWDTFGQAPLASDLQYLLILDQNQNWIDTLIWQRSNSQVWKYFEFSLKKFAGKTIKIQFGTYNDGYSGITSMYFDDVILNICQP